MSNAKSWRFRTISFTLMTALAGSLSVYAAPPTMTAVNKMTVPLKNTVDIDTDQLIVHFRNSTDINGVNKVLTKLRDEKKEKFRHVKTLPDNASVLKFDKRKGKDSWKSLEAWLKTHSEVDYVEPDNIMQPLAVIPDDSYFSYQWHYTDPTVGIRANEAWTTSTGQGAVVAVIDSGYRPHADLAANILPGYDFISNTTTANDGDGRDSDPSDPGDWTVAGECSSNSTGNNSSWHGTHVAGTIAAVTNNTLGVAGVAYNAKILPARVTGKCGGYTSDIIDAITWASGGAVAGVPANATPARVLNLSLGGKYTCGTSLQSAINAARAQCRDCGFSRK